MATKIYEEDKELQHHLSLNEYLQHIAILFNIDEHEED